MLEPAGVLPDLLLVAVVLLVLVLLANQVELRDQLGEVEAGLLGGKVYLGHV